jgi:hypothetical protein
MSNQRRAPDALVRVTNPGALCARGWVDPWAGLDGSGEDKTSYAHWGLNPNRPALSELLYRLRYPGPLILLPRLNIHFRWHSATKRNTVPRIVINSCSNNAEGNKNLHFGDSSRLLWICFFYKHINSGPPPILLVWQNDRPYWNRMRSDIYDVHQGHNKEPFPLFKNKT